MHVMVKLSLLGWLALTACASKRDAYDEVLAEMQALEVRMCGCPEPACRQAVFADLLAFRKTLTARLDGKPRPTDAQTRRGRTIDERLRACRRGPGDAAGGDDGDDDGEGGAGGWRRGAGSAGRAAGAGDRGPATP